MYGLVNKAIEQLITTRHGVDTWRRIKQAAKIDMDSFGSMDAYPDEITYALVQAASDELDLPVARLLEAFGEHWIHYTGHEGYGALMHLAGSTFVEFLQELDNLHSRVALSFPDLVPPSFDCTDIETHSVRLHYRSTRAGLAPMVVGLLRGLGAAFKLSGMTIEHDIRREDGAEHDQFLIRWVA
jgi:hypothetical protein